MAFVKTEIDYLIIRFIIKKITVRSKWFIKNDLWWFRRIEIRERFWIIKVLHKFYFLFFQLSDIFEN